MLTGRSAPAVVPEIDHRIGEGFECVVQLTEAIEAKQQSAELVFPSEHSFNRIEPLFKNGRLEDRLAASPGLFSTARIRVDVGDHAAIENRLAEVIPLLQRRGLFRIEYAGDALRALYGLPRPDFRFQSGADERLRDGAST